MKLLFKILSWLTGIWLSCSFVGVMFDSARASMWTQSLMWALLASVILAPALLFVATSSSDSSPSTGKTEKSFEDHSSQQDGDNLSNYAGEGSTYQDQ